MVQGNNSLVPFLIFQHDAVEEVLFEGYRDEKREEVVKEIATNKELQERMIEFKFKERENESE